MKKASKSFLIGKILKECRENSGLTQQQVANALGVDRSTYTYYELNHTTPSAAVIVKLSRIFNVPYSVFMESFMDSESKYVLEDSKTQGAFEPKIIEQGSQEMQEKERIYTLSKDEQSLVIAYRLLRKDQKEDLMTFVNEMNKKNSAV